MIVHRNVLVCGSPSCSASFGTSPFQSLAEFVGRMIVEAAT